ncbi:F0F1 ATP synthase subunit B' [Terrarubrum flagellatum]|uniref:F0F1 ATP synthase subunit B family protein n=1 Tax=Terrirubrum flagellatum TaxID=2895980 RepID=UPI0031450EAF
MISSAYAATAPHAAGPDAGVSFPPFDASIFASQLFWLAISFGALYWVMSNIALPRMAQLLEVRAKKIKSDLDHAADMQAKAQAAGEAYEKSLADARANAQGIAAQTRDKLNAEAESKRKTLETDLAARLIAAEKQVGETKTKALANVDSIAAEAAAAIVERLSGKAPAASDVAAAIAAAKN